ncbi:MAG: 30S ribosomal protein S17 [Candidatus Pacearchaeota archaeon]
MKEKEKILKGTRSNVELEKERKMQKSKIAGAVCNDPDCHIHGNLKTRGRFFEGKVTSKFYKRVAIEFERTVYIRKYERYKKSRTKIHARLPNCMKDMINIGDYIRVQECRPLSKIIHFAVIEKIRDADKITEMETKTK